MLLQWRAFIYIVSIAHQHVDARALLPTTNQISRRDLETCKPLVTITRDPPPNLLGKPAGDAEVDEEEDDDDIQSLQSESSNDDNNNTKPTSRRRSPADSAQTWHQTMIAGGRRLWQDLYIRLRNPSGDATSLCNGFASRWDRYNSRVSDLTEVWPRLVTELEYEDELEWESNLIVPKGTEGGDINDNSRIHYKNMFSTRQKAIVAIDNRSKRWNVEENRYDESATDHWSTAALMGWRGACKDDENLLKTLKYILRDNVINPSTEDAMDEVFRAIPWFIEQNGAHFRKTTLTPNDGDSFFMMLRTPNVDGVMHMLSEFVNTLGRKTIKEIGLAERLVEDNPETSRWIWVTLEDDDGQSVPGLAAESSAGLSMSDMADGDKEDPFYQYLSTVEIS